MRILLDEEDIAWDQAWAIVQNTFFYTNHTVLPVSEVQFIMHVTDRSLGSS